jgi:hypothetical protein
MAVAAPAEGTEVAAKVVAMAVVVTVVVKGVAVKAEDLVGEEMVAARVAAVTAEVREVVATEADWEEAAMVAG